MQDGVEIALEQVTEYPEKDTTDLIIHPAGPAGFEIRFRVPAWCSGAAARVNGQPVQTETRPGTWAVIRRQWTRGDRISIRFPMQLHYAPVDSQHRNRVALLYGPVVLVREHTPVLPARKDLASAMAKSSSKLEFQADVRQMSRFVPFYNLGHGRLYEMYFDVA